MSFQSALAAISGESPAAAAAAPAASSPAPTETAPSTSAQGASAALTPPPEGEAAPKHESASAAFQLIAKEKKRIIEMRQQAASREKELQDRETKLREQEGRFAKKPQTPLEALQAAGFSYKDATDFLINNEQLTPEQQVRSVKDELAQFKKEQEDARTQAAQAEKERAEAAHAQAVEGFKTQVIEMVAGNPEKYELSNLEDPDDIKNLGYQLADLHFNEHKKVLSQEEVADLVEGYLEERAAKLIAAKKIQAKWKPAETQAPGKEGAQAAPAAAAPTPPKTLAAAITSAPAPVYNPARSADERMKRAVEALERMGK